MLVTEQELREIIESNTPQTLSWLEYYYICGMDMYDIILD